MTQQEKTLKQKIVNQTKKDFAEYGYEGVSLRNLAKELNIAQSSVYNHFSSKDQMLTEIFEQTRKDLGNYRKQPEDFDTTYSLLKNRIDFQFKHATDITFILKYYFHFRKNFDKNGNGFVPKTAYTHIKEVLEEGIARKEIKKVKNIEEDAKVITHAVNGFVMEYYPNVPKGKEKEKLVTEITDFIYRAL